MVYLATELYLSAHCLVLYTYHTEDVASTFGSSSGTATVLATGGFGVGTIPKTMKKWLTQYLAVTGEWEF